MTRYIGLFRVMCKDSAPELRTVNTSKGETSVLNLNLVQYFTPGDYASPWIKVTLWGRQAEDYVALVNHNQGVYLDADLQYEGYVTEARNASGEDIAINRFSPKVARINEFRLVNVVKLPRVDQEVESATPSPVVAAAATAANTADSYSDMPF